MVTGRTSINRRHVIACHTDVPIFRLLFDSDFWTRYVVSECGFVNRLVSFAGAADMSVPHSSPHLNFLRRYFDPPSRQPFFYPDT